MFTKTLRNAVAATAATGALILPGAMAVAPQMSTVACQYPDSIVTDTKLNMQPEYVKGVKGQAVVVVSSDVKTPRGEVRFKIPAIDHVKVLTLNDDGQRKFRVPVGKLAPGKYTAYAKFFGNCRFKNSSDSANFSVSRKA